MVGALALLIQPVSAATAPTPTPTAVPSPGQVSSPASTPSAAASPSASPAAEGLQNSEAQGELIGTLTAGEVHALLLQQSINQAQLNLMALGQQLLDGRKQLEQLDHHLTDVESQRKDTAFRLQSDEQVLGAVVRRIYKHRQDFFAALLESGGFGGLLRVIGYSSVTVDREQTAIRRVRADAIALEHAQTVLERGRREQQAVVDRLTLTHTALSQQLQSEQDLQVQLQQTIDAALSALGAAQTDTPETAAERARLISLKSDALLRQIEQTVGAQATLLQLASLAPDLSGLPPSALLWPIPNAVISQGFGPTTFANEAAYAGYAHFHTGIDLAVPLGTPVFAAADGVVASAQAMTDSAGAMIGYGNYVMIQHASGIQTLYAHLLSFTVKPGDSIVRGQLIGLVGSTGNSTGPHTHFEVRIDNAPVDPMQLLSASGPAASLVAGAPTLH